eukprot:scaffold1487_cov116-Isochrysis_galbana.AAC.24
MQTPNGGRVLPARLRVLGLLTSQRMLLTSPGRASWSSRRRLAHKPLHCARATSEVGSRTNLFDRDLALCCFA